jgi:hypothetical protein
MCVCVRVQVCRQQLYASCNKTPDVCVFGRVHDKDKREGEEEVESCLQTRDCDFLSYYTHQNNTIHDFQVWSKHTDGYVAVAFSEDPGMVSQQSELADACLFDLTTNDSHVFDREMMVLSNVSTTKMIRSD